MPFDTSYKSQIASLFVAITAWYCRSKCSNNQNKSNWYSYDKSSKSHCASASLV